MQLLLILSTLVAASYAFVCLPDFCDNVKQPLLDCKGGVLKKAGVCGCTDVCAKVEGEPCRLTNIFLMGVPNTERCDDGLTCKTVNLEGYANTVCVDETKLQENSGMLASRKRRMVCPENICDSVEQPKLNCAGGILKNAGFCQCTDVCAKVEGEACQIDIPEFMGVPNDKKCDQGLVCGSVADENGVRSVKCIKASESSPDNLMVSRRSVSHCDTACRKKSSQCTFSFVIYPGQWFAKCDTNGDFLSQQCNNKKECFCVDKYTGTIDESTRVLGSAKC